MVQRTELHLQEEQIITASTIEKDDVRMPVIVKIIIEREVSSL